MQKAHGRRQIFMKKLLHNANCYGNSYTVEARCDVCVKKQSASNFKCVCGEYNYADDPDRHGSGRERRFVPGNDCVFRLQIRRTRKSHFTVSKGRLRQPGVRSKTKEYAEKQNRLRATRSWAVLFSGTYRTFNSSFAGFLSMPPRL